MSYPGYELFTISKLTIIIKYAIRAEYIFTFAGKFKRTKELTHDEEAKVVAHIKERLKLGCGMTRHQVIDVIQECIQDSIKDDPGRTSRWAHLGHRPNRHFVRRFLLRHRITARRSMPLHKGNYILS